MNWNGVQLGVGKSQSCLHGEKVSDYVPSQAMPGIEPDSIE